MELECRLCAASREKGNGHSLLTPQFNVPSWARLPPVFLLPPQDSYMQRHTGTHSSMQLHTPPRGRMCPNSAATLGTQTCLPQSTCRWPCTLAVAHPHHQPLPAQHHPPPHALTAPSCSDTGYNKFALVVTSRMWPWGGECPAALTHLLIR